MYAKEVVTRCSSCESRFEECLAGTLTVEGPCCASCAKSATAHEPRDVVTTLPEPPDPAPVAACAGRTKKRLPREEEDRVVAAVLKVAALPGDRIEHSGQPNVEAYRGLAKSRGVDLEVVVRADLRGELADVVRMPKVTR